MFFEHQANRAPTVGQLSPRRTGLQEAKLAMKGNDQNFKKLKRTYINRPIVLYVGAGSSRGNDPSQYGVPGWWGLLEQILRKGNEQLTKEDVACLDGKNDPWEAADFVLSKMPGGEDEHRAVFQSALWKIIQDQRNYPKRKSEQSKRDKLINGNFLNHNATLNAIVAFCGGISRWVYREPSETLDFICQPNRRVRAILTTNYDPFLESASTSKYRTDLLKPVAAYGSDAGTISQIPVFHIHGYVPHPDQTKDKQKRQPYLDNLVLDRSSYLKAWESTDVYGPTMLPQIHYLRNYTTLFIGFSFSDKKVNDLLKQIHQELASRKRNHYAFVSEEDFKKNTMYEKNFYSEIGIDPITYATPTEIPKWLGELYRAGLQADQRGDEIHIPWVIPKTHDPIDGPSRCTSGLEYWNALLCSRLCRVSKTKLISGDE